MDYHELKPYTSVMQNSLWHHDAYPELPDLHPRSSICMARFSGPGIVRTIHVTLNIEGDNRQDLLENVYLKICYNAGTAASVYVPVGDFFCDSFGGKSSNYASMLMAKRPTNSLYCYASMPFEKEITISLENTSDKLVTGYGYITAEKIPEWKSTYAYFHACWREVNALLPEDPIPLLTTKGKGHFMGCHITMESACPHFLPDFQGICEGNDEFFVDGSSSPVCNYLGTEDFFGFSWSWRKLWYDNYSGVTFLNDTDNLAQLACYRFLLNDPVRFTTELDARINYRNEIKNPPLQNAKKDGSGHVHYRVTVYWYQSPVVSWRR